MCHKTPSHKLEFLNKIVLQFKKLFIYFKKQKRKDRFRRRHSRARLVSPWSRVRLTSCAQRRRTSNRSIRTSTWPTATWDPTRKCRVDERAQRNCPDSRPLLVPLHPSNENDY